MWNTRAVWLVLAALCYAVICRPNGPEDVQKERDIFLPDGEMTDDEQRTFQADLIDIYCEHYRAGLSRRKPRCGKDLFPHCLYNGSVVLGSCRLKRSVCVEGVLEDFSFVSCAIH